MGKNNEVSFELTEDVITRAILMAKGTCWEFDGKKVYKPRRYPMGIEPSNGPCVARYTTGNKVVAVVAKQYPDFPELDEELEKDFSFAKVDDQAETRYEIYLCSYAYEKGVVTIKKIKKDCYFLLSSKPFQSALGKRVALTRYILRSRKKPHGGWYEFSLNEILGIEGVCRVEYWCGGDNYWSAEAFTWKHNEGPISVINARFNSWRNPTGFLIEATFRNGKSIKGTLPFGQHLDDDSWLGEETLSMWDKDELNAFLNTLRFDVKSLVAFHNRNYGPHGHGCIDELIHCGKLYPNRSIEAYVSLFDPVIQDQAETVLKSANDEELNKVKSLAESFQAHPNKEDAQAMIQLLERLDIRAWYIHPQLCVHRLMINGVGRYGPDLRSPVGYYEQQLGLLGDDRALLEFAEGIQHLVYREQMLDPRFEGDFINVFKTLAEKGYVPAIAALAHEYAYPQRYSTMPANKELGMKYALLGAEKGSGDAAELVINLELDEIYGEGYHETEQELSQLENRIMKGDPAYDAYACRLSGYMREKGKRFRSKILKHVKEHYTDRQKVAFDLAYMDFFSTQKPKPFFPELHEKGIDVSYGI